MLRKTGLIFASAVLFWGCDLFSTSEVFSKPSEIRSLAGLAKAKDSVAYSVRESLWSRSAHTLIKEISRRRLVFTFLGDSLDGDDTLKALSLRISDDSTGAQLEKSARWVRFSKDGIRLETTVTGGGARFFPLKASAESAPAAAAGPDAAADTGAFLALPSLLVQGWNEAAGMGIFRVRREQISIDTLGYQGHLEETWGIRETILSGDSTLATGLYHYGKSGLLRADLIWPAFDWRDEDGSNPAAAELRRALVRL